MREELSRSKGSRGFTLIESLVALGVLGLGALAAVGLVTILAAGTASISAQTEAIALASRVMAEVHDARFVVGAEDPGLVVGAQTASDLVGGEIVTPVPNSGIRSVGTFPAVNPRFQVSYEVRWCAQCENPFGGAEVGLRAVDVLVTVRDISEEGTEHLLRPLFFAVRKEYSPSAAGAGGRGWQP